MGKRTLVISDIHGCYREFNTLLNKAGYDDKNDKLILLGDYMDRGFHSKHVIELVIDLVNNTDTIALLGNHDDMFLNAMLKGEDRDFLHNGGAQTISSFCGDEWLIEGINWSEYLKCKDFIKKNHASVIWFLRNLPLYHEDESHIYVHAGLSPLYNDWDWQKQDRNNFLWIRSEFLNIDSPYSKIIVHGHTPNTKIHDKPDIYFRNGKIGIDGGCCFGSMYQLNCLVIEDGEYKTYSVKKGEYL
jgi:serine/threonine protein phosphatase 1